MQRLRKSKWSNSCVAALKSLNASTQSDVVREATSNDLYVLEQLTQQPPPTNTTARPRGQLIHHLICLVIAILIMCFEIIVSVNGISRQTQTCSVLSSVIYNDDDNVKLLSDCCVL